jgi:lipopolysaccharide/colanic/teichoic acid biosynthesis glycosyltransferase
MLVIAVLIRVTSRGPVVFTQTRVGIDRRRTTTGAGNSRRRADRGGRPFTIYKFRTMRPTNGDAAAEVWASPDDPRVTRLGRILRKYRLDELPQLVNVLLGDMNLVGPRPEQPAIFTEMQHRIPGYGQRQWVLPGITGLAQVRHRYDSSVDDVRRKVTFDLEYSDRRSALEDLRIMALTIPVVVFRRGAW